MNKAILITFLVLMTTGVIAQTKYNSIEGILSKGRQQIPMIEKDFRIIEKTIYDILEENQGTTVSEVQYFIIHELKYRVSCFLDAPHYVNKFILRVFEESDLVWSLKKEYSSSGSPLEIEVESEGSTMYKFEISCEFKNPETTYVRYGFFIDREL